jgi:diguanylate cyclase (GGDEF)-like protein/PAS domain S-box-containing protein
MAFFQAIRWQALFGSLKLRLALTGVAVIGASVALTVWLVLSDVGGRAQRAVLDAEQAQAERLATVLSNRLVGLQLALRGASADLAPASLASAPAVFAFLRQHRVLTDLFASTYVARADGRLLAIVDERGLRDPGIGVADRAYFQRTLKEQRSIISEAVVGRVSGEANIILTHPLHDADGRIVGILAGSLRLATRSLMADLTRVGNSAYDPVTTIITDTQGRIISHPSPEWILRDAQAEPRIADAVAQWVAQGRPVEPQGNAMRLGDDIVATAGVPDADWVLFRTARADTLLGGIAAGKRQALWLGVAVAFAGGGLIALATLILLQPLRQLQRRAQRLEDDELAPEDGWPVARGEIGQLSHAFRHAMQQRAASQREREQMLARMRAVMGHAPAGILFTRERKFELVSECFGRMFGYPSAELIGESPRLIYASDEVYQNLGARVAAAFGAGRPFDEEIEFVRRDGSRFWGRLQGAPVKDGDPGAGTIWIVADIGEAREQRERLSWSATHDPLTELFNRREFEARLARLVAERKPGDLASAFFIDLDRFTAVNVCAGHAAGDALLKDVAAILAEGVRASDTVARLGGDEFGVLLPGCTRETAVRIAEQMRARVEAYRLEWQGLTMQVGASIGLVEIDGSLESAAAVMAAADAACYESKRAGRNQVRSHAVPAHLRLVDSSAA